LVAEPDERYFGQMQSDMSKRLDVLIVDDNIGFSDRMAEMLEGIEQVWSIHIAANYEEGHRLFFEEKPALVLLDINLPGKNGIHLLKVIHESKCECDVIMITNHTNDHYRQQCLDLGVKYFLDKSNDFGMVPAIIHQRVMNQAV
jgi:response regulator of citrate/malate metabolism